MRYVEICKLILDQNIQAVFLLAKLCRSIIPLGRRTPHFVRWHCEVSFGWFYPTGPLQTRHRAPELPQSTAATNTLSAGDRELPEVRLTRTVPFLSFCVANITFESGSNTSFPNGVTGQWGNELQSQPFFLNLSEEIFAVSSIVAVWLAYFAAPNKGVPENSQVLFLPKVPVLCSGHPPGCPPRPPCRHYRTYGTRRPPEAPSWPSGGGKTCAEREQNKTKRHIFGRKQQPLQCRTARFVSCC